MKIYRSIHDKFNIDDESAASIMREIFFMTSGNSDYTDAVIQGDPDDAFEKNTIFRFLIPLCASLLVLTLIFPVMLLLTARTYSGASDPERQDAARMMADMSTYDTTTLTKGARDNTPLCLIPMAPGIVTYGNNVVHIDASNTSEGYIIARYTGDCPKVKLRVTGPDEITYTYNMATDGGEDEVFPLQAGDGTYLVGVFENISDIQYATAFSQEISVVLSDPMLPFLYPNQYVTFDRSSQAIAYAEYLSYTADTDLDVVSNIYNALISSMSYDYEEAETVESGYLPDIDEVLTTGKGICLDYAVLMTSMLRSQQIPTRMEVGYAGSAYHAWISTYIKDIGWVNGMIRFDGKEWSLMDPTFASTTDTEKLANFIGDGTNYVTKYIY